MISLKEILVFTGSLLAMMIIFRERKRKRKDNGRYPPSFPSLPIVGSLPFIKDFEDIPKYFLQKSYELGPVFTLKFGSRRSLILNSREAIEDAFVRHASSFSGREGLYTEGYFNIQLKGLAHMNYHEAFKKYQRLTLSTLKDFGYGSKRILETRILMEVAELIDYFQNLNAVPFDPKDIITLSTSNVLINILLGTRTKYEDGMNETCDLMKRYVATIHPALQLFPILRFIPPHITRISEMKDVSGKLLNAVKNDIEECLTEGAEDCFVRRYVEKEGPDYDREQLLFTVRDFIGASADTTSTTMLWAFILLANNPQIMQKVQREIDSVIPRDRLPKTEDEQKMPFTQATILEVLRFRPVLSMALPHLTLHDTTVMGYFVPADTVAIPNIRAAHMNRSEWQEPEVFRSERFLDKDDRVINPSKVIAFSMGRRACIGESLARQTLFLFLTGILQTFTIRPPDGIQSISEKIVFCLVESPEPFKIRMIPR